MMDELLASWRSVLLMGALSALACVLATVTAAHLVRVAPDDAIFAKVTTLTIKAAPEHEPITRYAHVAVPGNRSLADVVILLGPTPPLQGTFVPIHQSSLGNWQLAPDVASRPAGLIALLLTLAGSGVASLLRWRHQQRAIWSQTGR